MLSMYQLLLVHIFAGETAGQGSSARYPWSVGCCHGVLRPDEPRAGDDGSDRRYRRQGGLRRRLQLRRNVMGKVHRCSRYVRFGVYSPAANTNLHVWFIAAPLLLQEPYTCGVCYVSLLFPAGAILGILTSTLASTFAQSRIIAAVGRQHLLPPVLALVHPKFGTPYVATILSGVATAVIALFTGRLCRPGSCVALYVFLQVALCDIDI